MVITLQVPNPAQMGYGLGDLDLEGRFDSLKDAQKVWEQRNDAGAIEHPCTEGGNQ